MSKGKYVKLSNLLAGLECVEAVVILTAKLGYKRDLPQFVYAHTTDRAVLERVECFWGERSLEDAIDYANAECRWLAQHPPENYKEYHEFDELIQRWFEEVK